MGLALQDRRRMERAINWLAVAAGVWCWWNCLPPAPNPWFLNLANNPDKFFLWGTLTNYEYTFTYDPRAADDWSFEHGFVPETTLPLANIER